MRAKFHTYRNLSGHVRKFTGIRKEIYAHTYAFSRENENRPKTRRFDHFRNLKKQSSGCEIKYINLNFKIMKIRLMERANPQDRTKKKIYANPVNAGHKTLHEIAADISGRSSLTRGDVENVLSNFVDRLPGYLKDGFSVQLGEFATMRLGLSSKGAVDEKSFDTETIKPYVILTPSVDFKEQLRNISYEREVKKKKP